MFIDLVAFSQDACEVDNQALFTKVVDACQCKDISIEICEIALGVGTGPTITCKSAASQKCKNEVTNWEDAYKNISNPENCKASQITANECSWAYIIIDTFYIFYVESIVMSICLLLTRKETATNNSRIKYIVKKGIFYEIISLLKM